MFCHKCGAQIAEGADFCHKCGSKAAYADAAQQPIDKSPSIIGQENVSAEAARSVVTAPVHFPDTVTHEEDFKEFVDKHVRVTTKFQSAEDLLENSKPHMFLWYCFGIPAVIGLAAGGPVGALVFGFVFGHTARWIAGGIIRNRYIVETIGRFEGNIDISDLLQFLNVHLSYLHPYFHEGKYNAGVLSIPFGIRQKSTAIIHIMPDKESAGSDSWKYVFDAQNNPSMLSRIIGASIFTLIQICEPRHTCLFKTVPILQAAMEYYLTETIQGENNNVLS